MSVKLFFNPLLIHLFKLSLSVCYQKIIEDVEEMLNNLPGVTSVHGRFYDLSSKYYRIIGNHAAYYKDALRYLGCVDIKDLPGRLKAWWEMALLPCWSTLLSSILFITYTEMEKQERAFTLGLAGLLGEGVYNFGELVGSACVSFWAYARESSMDSPLHLLSQLMHPVLESLRNTDKQWLIDTLYAFNGGNVEKFQSYKSSWGQQVIPSFYISASSYGSKSQPWFYNHYVVLQLHRSLCLSEKLSPWTDRDTSEVCLQMSVSFVAWSRHAWS